ncbi:MAG: hypothetical protein GTN53_38390, partial [Candidatus Aminicenantes bacterium]|nr:hypothetical protein [Candidatus Aminicenantes bacterium]NIQ72347.1 hypothetical protein [Candidatus Aminicenantes bacterium]NIT28385.1 hypothetical protein [Candidatus Aminicenantes bacterium]
MLTKKKVLAAAAIICVMVLSLFLVSQLQAITCTGRSDCGSCRVVDCDSGGCTSAASGHACICDDIITHL